MVPLNPRLNAQRRPLSLVSTILDTYTIRGPAGSHARVGFAPVFCMGLWCKLSTQYFCASLNEERHVAIMASNVSANGGLACQLVLVTLEHDVERPHHLGVLPLVIVHKRTHQLSNRARGELMEGALQQLVAALCLLDIYPDFLLGIEVVVTPTDASSSTPHPRPFSPVQTAVEGDSALLWRDLHIAP